MEALLNFLKKINLCSCEKEKREESEGFLKVLSGLYSDNNIWLEGSLDVLKEMYEPITFYMSNDVELTQEKSRKLVEEKKEFPVDSSNDEEIAHLYRVAFFNETESQFDNIAEFISNYCDNAVSYLSSEKANTLIENATLLLETLQKYKENCHREYKETLKTSPFLRPNCRSSFSSLSSSGGSSSSGGPSSSSSGPFYTTMYNGSKRPSPTRRKSEGVKLLGI